MQSKLVQKKYKQNITKLNSIINQYEFKLDQRVNQVVSDIINHTKMITDPPLIPVLHHKKIDTQHIKQHKKTASHNNQISFLTNISLQHEMQHLRITHKNIKSEKNIPQPGRSVGSHAIKKPKFIKKKPQILSRQMRLNPFSEKNAIKAFELDKGLYNLLQKGKIGKDVNIITAFEKGKPILQAKKVIFHEGQQRFAQLQVDKSQKFQTKQKQSRKQRQKKDNLQERQRIYDQSWALTMPKDESYGLNLKAYDTISQQKLKVDLVFKERLYLKIVNFQTIQDKNYKIFMNKHMQHDGEIRQILHQLQKVMGKYSIDIGYADSLKIVNFITRVTKIQKEQLISCLVNKDNTNFFAIKNIRIYQLKKVPALDKIVTCFKFYFYRKQFLNYLTKKKIANKIYGWAVSRCTVRKRLQQVVAMRKIIEENHQKMQNSFKESYDKIQSQKHYEIHLINQRLQGKEKYKQYRNTQITRIFNLSNVNKHIIYLLNERLDEETINYNYKIMELEQIPNYKERVTFLEVDPNQFFKQHNLSLSAKYYYNTQVIRKIKKKIKDSPAYLVISYPSLIDITLSVYLNMPILGGSLLKTLQLQKLTNLSSFGIDITDRYIINPDNTHKNLTAFSDELIQYCAKLNIKQNKYVVKLNDKNRSLGLGLLSLPFSSLPQLYQNTYIISSKLTVDQFYHILLREGGIIQRYDESMSQISVVIFLQTDGKFNVLGTFQKVSSGFINIAYNFPQKKIENKWLLEKVSMVADKLYLQGHFGYSQISFLVDQIQQIYLEKVQCYFTHLGSSLFYYKFLSQGSINQQGQYMAKIIDNIQKEDGGEEELISLQPRCFSYVPYLLHFGLSDRQINSFFQLCRMGGVSFDLQNKYGATFILIGSLKKSMGLITTAKDKKGSVKLMLKSLEFIIKQNSHNMSAETLSEKQVRMKERENIINIKQRFEDM